MKRNNKHIIAAAIAVAMLPAMTAMAQPFTRAPLTAAQRVMKASIPGWQPRMGRTVTELPASVDNSTNRFFPAIFSQGSNNSCSQASGVRYVYTYEVNRMFGRDASNPANVFCYHFTWNFLNEGNNEGSHSWIGWDLMKDCGTLDMTRFKDEPYSYSQQTQWLSGYDTYIEAMKYRVSGYTKINLKTREGIDLMRRYLYDHGDGGETGGVASISYETEDWGLKSYTGPSLTGLRHIVTKEGKDGPHAITLVGYDDTVEYDFDGDGNISDTERGAFIFANSWDDYWASDGKCYIPYSVMLADYADGGLSEGDADAYMVTPVIGDPDIVFKVKLSYNRRNELSFLLGAADGDDAKMPSVDFTYPVMNRQGGAVPMQGNGASNDIEVAFNFSRYHEAVKGYADPKFFLTVRRTAATGTGKIIEFSVLDVASGTQYLSSDRDIELKGGQIVLTTGKSLSVYPSCSKWRWLLTGTYAPISSPFVVKTATGKAMKMMINGYDRTSGKLTIKYHRL